MAKMQSEMLVDALAHTAFVVMAVLSRVAAEYDLSLTQLRVLGILRDHRPRITELADHLGLEKSTLSGLVDRAERRGLLARERSAADSRAVEVVMTDAGIELAHRIYARLRAELAPLTDRVAGSDRQKLGRLLEHMVGE